MSVTTPPVIWHGTQQEGTELITALEKNCECERNLMGLRTKTCPAHEAFANDQQWLDRLLFLRRIRDKLNREEDLT